MPQPADVSSARPRRFGRASVGALSSEKFTWDQVVKAEKAWGVDAVNWLGGTWTVRLPDPWVDVSEDEFAEWFSPKCQIVVRRCEKRR